MITTINEFKKTINENNNNISLTFDIGPGGSINDIMNDWNLTATEENEQITIYGLKDEVYAFADEYGLSHLIHTDTK